MLELSPKIWAIVPAAGSGQRMAKQKPKQYLELHGKSILEHTLSVLAQSPLIQETLVCISPNDPYWRELGLQTAQTTGGDSRAQSVLNGLIALQDRVDDNDWVLVHDAARPCLQIATLTRFIEKVQNHPVEGHPVEGHPVGGILAMRCKDTLKRAESTSNEIAATLDRSLVWQAQTPQMFRYGLLLDALIQALAQGAAITDEASAMEIAGHKPILIEGDARNLKVTTPEDLALAEFLLRS